MGCDIHGRVQIKRWNGQEVWEDLMEIPDDRNYCLFSRLAGVRQYNDDDPVIAQPRGLPGDFNVNDDDEIEIHHVCSDEACIERYWVGDHSHSWLTLDEMLAWDGWNLPHPGNAAWQDPCDTWLKFLTYLKARNFHQCRVVFGFDS